VARVVLEESGEKSPIKFQCELARDLLQCAEGESELDRTLLNLASTLTRLQPDEMPVQLLATLAERGLRSPDFDVRSLALSLLLQPPFSKNEGLLTRAVPFLQDVAAEVRRVALLAVGSHADLVTDDELLPLLHDADAEVCRLCEIALRSRGLEDQHIVLARLISDERPTARLEVLRYLELAGDLDPGVWLRRLCQDSSPAVRAAAARAAANQDVADLRDRLRDMAQNDASPTVRQIAGHYLHSGAIGKYSQ
jgi:HEAT repeat protein